MDHPSDIEWCILPEVVHSEPSASSLHLFKPVDTCTGMCESKTDAAYSRVGSTKDLYVLSLTRLLQM